MKALPRARFLLVVSLALAARGPDAMAAGLTEAPRLASVYDSILQGRFDQAESQLARTCPPAPRGACQDLRVVSLWWQIQLDPGDRRLDHRFGDLAAAAIAENDAWTAREPTRAEAWFYLAGSYAPLVQWRVLRGERVAAARDGKKIKDALERTLALDPTIDDAYFGIGLYHYYADVLPAAAKVLRWLLFLPGGDRVRGLREMLQARDRGELLRGEADYQLHWLYLWYEQRYAQALRLLEGLRDRYPENPLFLQRIAEVHEEYFHDHPAAEAAWTLLLQHAQSNRVNAAAIAAVRARLGLARELDAMDETDRAVEHLTTVALDRNPQAPYLAQAQAQLQLGLAYDRLGQRGPAVAAYRAASAMAPADDPQHILDRARAGLRQQPDQRAADAYRTSLDGWRRLERGDGAGAASALGRAVLMAPADSVIRYRYGKAREAIGDRAGARDAFERVIVAQPAAAPFVLASAYADLAAIVEDTGDRARALALYQSAAGLAGGTPAARDRAARAVAHLGAQPPRRDFF